MSIPEVFRRITEALDRAGIPYMLTGSFASAHYGAPRSTQDVDLVIDAAPAQLGAFLNALPAPDYYVDADAAREAHQRRSMFNAIDLSTGWKIDFIFRKPRPFSREEFGRRQKAIIQGISLFITTLEDTVISKLEWAKLGQSQRQIEDVVTILRARWAILDRAYVEKWIGEIGLEEEWNQAKNGAGITN